VKWLLFSKRTAGQTDPEPRLPRIRLPSRDKLVENVREACLAAGFFMLARGLWLVYPPAMWVVCGALLIYVGLPPRGVPKPPERR
jgi:hypothetical protein